MPHKRIFISHAAKDKELADALVDLLQTGMNLHSDDIFCSSLEGLRIPSGSNFLQHIKDLLQNPDVVIALLSPNYYESHFCLCELGATWAMSHTFLPLMVPPLTAQDLGGVMLGIQITDISKASDLTEFQQRLLDALAITKINQARWEAKRNAFVKRLSSVLNSIGKPNTIPIHRFEELSQKYKEGLEALAQSYDEIETLKQQIRDLKECKNREEVREIERKYSTEQEQFENLVQNAKLPLKELPDVVIEALYYHFRDEPMPSPNVFDEIKNEEVRTQEEYDYLHISRDGHITIVESNPEIEAALGQLQTLYYFIRNTSEEFKQSYKELYHHRLNFNSRTFWQKHLSL